MVLGIAMIVVQYGVNKVNNNFDDIFVYGAEYLSAFLPQFIHCKQEKPLNYSDPSLYAWVGHPDKDDLADHVPPLSPPEVKDEQATAAADVFFVYPTGYFGWKWNSPTTNHFISDTIAESTLLVHAQIFNGVARVYSPFYRQMTGFGYFANLSDPGIRSDRDASFDLAYEDVLKAFDHYVTNWNKGRPIFILGQSQGSQHLMRLLKDRFKKGSELRKQLVVAYVVSAPIHYDDIGDFEVCVTPEQTQCIIGYNVFIEGGDLSKFILSNTPEKLVCVNPLTWEVTNDKADAYLNEGSRPVRVKQLFFNSFKPHTVSAPLEKGAFSAQCKDGVVWTNAPRTSGFDLAVFPGKNYHGSESSMFWMNTRRNAEKRLKHFLSRT